jgi:hypothetical protein
MLFAILASKIKAVITSSSKQFPPFVEFRAWEVDPAQDKVGSRIFLLAHLLLANKPWHPGELRDRLDLRIRSRLSLGVSFMKGSRVVPPVANPKGQANLKVQAKLRLQHQRLRHQGLLLLDPPMECHRVRQLRWTQILMKLLQLISLVALLSHPQVAMRNSFQLQLQQPKPLVKSLGRHRSKRRSWLLRKQEPRNVAVAK